MKSCVVLLTTIAVFAISSTSMAEDVYINGGTYTFNDATHENDEVYLGHDGSSTNAHLVDNGRVGWLSAYSFSMVRMTGGEIVHQLVADNSLVDISGGTIGGSLIAQNSGSVDITGGTVGSMLEVDLGSKIHLYGTNFEVTDLNGVTASLSPGDKLSDFGTLVSESGQIPYYTGAIKGTLAYGTALDNTFKIEVFGYGGLQYGDIYIRKHMTSRATVVALSQNGTGLLLKNNSTVTIVTDGHPLVSENIIVNSLADDAMQVQGKINISADRLQVAGSIDLKGSLSYPEEMGILENLRGAPDFYERVGEPNYVGLPDMCLIKPTTGKTLPVVITEGEWILKPGYYSAGIIVKGGIVTFEPGIYTLGASSNANSGLIIKGDAVVDANEVMFHIVGTGQVSVGKNATLTATAQKNRDYKNILFFQSRENTNPAIFKGIANCGGKLYFPANHVEVTGNVLCSMLMADTIELSVNGELTVNPNYPLSE